MKLFKLRARHKYKKESNPLRLDQTQEFHPLEAKTNLKPNVGFYPIHKLPAYKF